MMEAAVWQPRDDEDARIVERLPVHVVAALDHLTRPERDGVLAAIGAFARYEQEGNAIPGSAPLYLLWATPEMRVIVRRANPDGPVEVEDVVRPATLRAFVDSQCLVRRRAARSHLGAWTGTPAKDDLAAYDEVSAGDAHAG